MIQSINQFRNNAKSISKSFFFSRFSYKYLLLTWIFIIEFKHIYGSSINCNYKYYTDVGYTCEINSILPIGDEPLTIGGNETENKKIKTLLFSKVNPGVIPKEFFEGLPQLTTVGMLKVETKLVDLHFLSNFLQHAYELNTLYLAHNRIEMIEPKALAIFKNFRTIRLEGNNCIKQTIKIQNCNLNEVKANLTNCFNNFFTNYPERNTTDQLQILESEAIPEYVFVSGESQVVLSYSVVLVLLIIQIVMSGC